MEAFIANEFLVHMPREHKTRSEVVRIQPLCSIDLIQPVLHSYSCSYQHSNLFHLNDLLLFTANLTAMYKHSVFHLLPALIRCPFVSAF